MAESQGVRLYKIDEENDTLKEVKKFSMDISYVWYEPIGEVMACTNYNDNGRIFTFFFKEKK